MIQIDHLKKSYAGLELFDDASFKINARERIGLVGRNGHGKTTLMRIFSGEEQADEGEVLIPKNYRLGYLKQHLHFSREGVLGEVASCLPAEEEGEIWKAEKILSGLGFSEKDMAASPHTFSGGFQIRIHLAKILVSEPDLLLLDEPTNYLDITSIRWLERFLSAWPRELILITHDRSFMDRVATHVVGIHRKRIRKIKGDTEKYYAQLAQEEEIHEKTRLNDEKKRKEMELFITRFRAKARLAGMVQSRIKTLNRMEKRDKLENIKDLEFSFPYLPTKGKHALRAENLSFGYDPGNFLIRDFSITLDAGERLCLIGKNGRGKTTLLKLLSGITKALSGEVTPNPGIVGGVYEQTHISNLHPERTVEEEIQASEGSCDRQTARNVCGAMMFEGDQALKSIRVLSGGEKSRVMLGKLLVKPHNLLFLDEPTNHLDMNSCDALLEALDAFSGALVMVTHNEMFLHALADRLVVFGAKGPEIFDGSYQEFLEKVGWEEEREGEVFDEKPAMTKSLDASDSEASGKSKTNKKDLRKLRSEILQKRAQVLKPMEKEMEKLEERLEKKETRLSKLTLEMQEFSEKGEGLKVAELAREMAGLQKEIDLSFSEFERLSLEHEKLKAPFDEELKVLES